jgi:hypothetical protein
MSERTKIAARTELKKAGLKFIGFITLISVCAFSAGCVNVRVLLTEPLPPDTVVNVHTDNQISLWKSNTGQNNAIHQNTDATLPISAMGSQSGIENPD